MSLAWAGGYQSFPNLIRVVFKQPMTLSDFSFSGFPTLLTIAPAAATATATNQS